MKLTLLLVTFSVALLFSVSQARIVGYNRVQDDLSKSL